MPNATLLSATLALLLCSGAAAAEQRILIRAGQVIDVDNAVVLKDQAILIDSGRIVSLLGERQAASGQTRVSLSFGIVQMNSNDTMDEALRRADQAFMNVEQLKAAGHIHHLDLLTLLIGNSSWPTGHARAGRELSQARWAARQPAHEDFASEEDA